MRLSLRARQIIGIFTLWSFVFQNSIAIAASTIQTHNKYKTNTTINNTGNIYDISTTTNVNDMGVNAFKKFDVGNGDTVNLRLSDTQNKILNLVYDGSASQINGIVNSLKNGKVAGNILFANPHGFVIGADGTFNVGSLTLITPSQDTMESLFDSKGQVLKQPITDLVSFEIDNDQLLKLKKNVEIDKDATIKIEGTINSQNGVNIIAGKGINVSGTINANLADVLVNTSDKSFTTAIFDGKDIIIATKDQMDGSNKEGNTVKISGTVDARAGKLNSEGKKIATNKGAGNVLISAQSHSTHNDSEVIIKSGAEIFGNNVDITAVQNAEEFTDNVLGISDDAKKNAFITEDIVEYFTGKLADLGAKVTIEGGEITAINDLKIASEINAKLSSSHTMAVLAVNYTQIDSHAETLIKSGAKLTAKNLEATSKNNIELDMTSKSSSLSLVTDKNKAGDLAVGVLVQNVSTLTTIEKDVTLAVANNLTVSADTSNYIEMAVKNGIIPVIDKNEHGGFSGSIAVAVIDVTTKAIMNADADIGGSLKVTADAIGRLNVRTTAEAGGEGESGTAAKYGKTLVKNMLFGDGAGGTSGISGKVYGKLNDIKTRGNADFNKFDLSAGVSVAVADYATEATIGNETIAPNIQAKNVEVSATTIDDKSSVVAISTAANAEKAIAGAVAVNIRNFDTKAAAYGDYTITNTDAATDALKVYSKTEILHPLSYYQYWNQLVDSLNFSELFSSETWNDIVDILNQNALDMDGNLSMPDLSPITDKFFSPDLDLLLKGPANTSNFGLDGLYNTYAQAASSAKTKEGSTTAFAGAITISVMDSTSQAILGKGTKVTLKGADATHNKTTVASEVHNQIWAMSGIFAPLEITQILSGSSARDGDSIGAGIAFNYSNNNSTAHIERDVKINQDSGKMGNVDVTSDTTGHFVTVTFGSSNSDETGMSGALGLTLTGGETGAYIEGGSNIKAGNLKVSATNDTNYVNAVAGVSFSDEAFAIGISGIGIFDTVKAFIDGTIFAEKDISVNAKSDKLLVNVTNNVSIAKSGTKDPNGATQQNSEDKFKDDGDTLSLADTFVGMALGMDKIPTKWDMTKSQLADIEATEKLNYDWDRAVDQDKDTKAYAGSITANVLTTSVDAYIADNANITSGKDLLISAVADVLSITEAGAVSANGKSGGGGAIVADVTSSDVTAKIGKNAIVNAANSMNINALQDYLTIQAGVGVASAKNSAGAGTLGSTVQVNTTKAYIDEGAQINQTGAANATQFVSLNAKNNTMLVKGLGALAIQSGGNGEKNSAKGGTIDANVIVNTAEATIIGSDTKRTKVSAKGEINVEAANDNFFINADVAGAASTGGDAYAGLASTNVFVNTTTAGINYTDITGTAAVDVTASDNFREIVVAGLVSAGKDGAVGATVRADVLNNAINSYITNSNITAKSLSMNNNSIVDQLSIIASGAGSSNGKAAVGSVGVLVALSNQTNHIDNSVLTLTNNLNMNSTSTIDSLAVTGSVGASTGGTAAGGSMFGLIAKNDVSTYTKNTNINASDVTMTSSAKDKVISVAVGGSLSTGGSAYSGSISAITNVGDVETYVDGGTIEVSNKVDVSAEKEVNVVQINGQANVSTSGSAIGGAVATTVNTNNVSAYIKNAAVTALNGIKVAAESIKKFVSTPVGVSGGKDVAVQGSVDTYVIVNNVNSYIKDSTLKTSGDVEITADESLNIVSAAGGASVSTGSAAVGAAVFSGVFSGATKAYVDNVTLNSDGNVNALKVAANSSEDLDIITISGGVSTGSVAATGVVQTIVIDKDTNANVNKLTANADIKAVNVTADTNTNLIQVAGQAAVSTSGVGAGGTIETTVINKNVDAIVNASTFKALNTVNVASSSIFDNVSTVIGVSVGSSAAVQGAVSTKVLNVDSKAQIAASTITGTAAHTVSSSDMVDVVNTLATASASGTAAVGGTVGSIVNNNSSYAGITETSTLEGKSLSVTSNMEDDYVITLANAAAAGTAAVAGAVNTIVLNTSSEAEVNKATGTFSTGDMNVTAKNDTEVVTNLGQAAGAGTAAVGASVTTLVSNKTTLASIKDANLNIKAGKLNVTAKSIDNMFSGVAGGAGAGTAAVVGSINTVVFDNATSALVDNSAIKVAGNTTVQADEELTLGGYAGAGAGAGVAAVGASIFTGVINNKTTAKVNKTDIGKYASQAGNLNIVAKTIEKIGNGSAPIFNIAGSGAGVANVNGVVNTFVITSGTAAEYTGMKTAGADVKNLTVDASADTSIFAIEGSGGGAGVASVGATAGTFIVNKDVSALISGGKFTVTDAVKVSAKNTDKLNVSIVAGGGAGVAAVNGAVSTNVISNNVSARVLNSVIKTGTLDAKAEQDTDVFMVVGSASGAGVAGVGASILSNVLENRVTAMVDSDVEATGNINVEAKSTDVLQNNTVSGAGGGAAGVAGAVNTNVIGNNVQAGLKGKIKTSDDAKVAASAKTEFKEQSTGVAAGGIAGVGASVQTNVINNRVNALARGKINAKNLTVNAKAEEIMTDLFALGFAAGAVSGAGTTLVNVINTNVMAYTENATELTLTGKLAVDADSQTKINSVTATGAAGGTGVGASVMVNTINKNVGAYTGTLNTIKGATDVKFAAKSTNFIGESNKSLKTIAGSVGVIGAGIAGSVLVNTVSDTVVAGLGANNAVHVGKLSIDATNNTSVYTDVGAGAAGLVGVGATVNVNNINNTTNAFIGNKSTVLVDGNLDMNANSNTKMVNNGMVVSGGAAALSGGVVVSNVGQNVASLDGDAETKRNADAAIQQAKNATLEANQKVAEARATISSAAQDAKNQANAEVQTAQENTNTMLNQGLGVELGGNSQPDGVKGYATNQDFGVTVNLPSSTGMTTPPSTPALRNNATSAIIDSYATVDAKNININAKDVTNITLKTTGANLGIAAIGVSGTVANTSSTTEVLIGTNAKITSQEKLDVKAESDDIIRVDSIAASGGVVTGSGNFAVANSSKNARVQTLSGAKLTSIKDNINITANSKANIQAKAWGGNFGGITVGASIAKANANGQTAILLGEANTLNAYKNINLSSSSDMYTNAVSEALAGALIGGTGADARTSTGQNVSIEIGGNLNASADEDINLKSDVKNNSSVTANARAYGLVAAGGAVAEGNVTGGSKVSIADGTSGKVNTVSAKNLLASSLINNDVYAKTYAGSGAIVGVGGSKSGTSTNVTNTVYIGSNHDIKTKGTYGLIGSTNNKYRSYTDSSAYGLVAAGAGIVKNAINSTVNVTSNADIAAGDDISIYAYNNTHKDDNGYDLEGGAGGLVGVGSANLETSITHNTSTTFGGNKASTKGELTVLAENNVDVTEKVKVYAAGGVPIAAGYSNVNRKGESINATTNIANKNITAQEDILYGANSNVRMYSKSDVTTRGLAPVADGESFVTGSVNNNVYIKSGSNTYGNRDVFVEALSSLNIRSQMYSDSEGLLWDFGDADVQAAIYANNKITSEINSLLSSYDKMTLTTRDSSSLSGTKTAKTKFYLVFGIPISKYNYKNSDGNISKEIHVANNNIVINGSIKSGEGANRTLTIESDGISGNMDYTETELELEATEEDIKEVKTSLDGNYTENKDKVTTQQNTAATNKRTAEQTKTTNETIKSTAEANIAIATNASEGFLDLKSVAVDDWTENQAATIKQAVLDSNLPNKAALAAKIKVDPTLTDTEIANIATALDQASDVELAKIPGYNTTIGNAKIAIAQAENLIEKYTKEITAYQDILDTLLQRYNKQLAELNQQLSDIQSGSLVLSMIDVKDTVVRSGEVVLTGKVSGNGTITAPGNAFSIVVNNNTPNSISFNKLVIEDNARGKIYINGTDIMGSSTNIGYGGISMNLKSAAKSPLISINNNVDAMDSSYDRLNNAGDLVFNGLVQNTYGDLVLRNLTGSIITDAPMYAKTISMFIPNGNLDQGFTNSQTNIAGADGTGAGIYAGGDITIMARTINVNGVIQSGTVDKNVVINDFILDNACNETACSQFINGIWVPLEKSPNKAKSSWYLLSGDATTGIDMTNPDNPNTIKAYYDINTGEIVLFRADIMGGDITLIGDVVSTGQGEIKLMSGYGHIDIANNTDKTLVVSDLNADTKLDGKLTIYDFKDGVYENSDLMNYLELEYQLADKKNLESSTFWQEMLNYSQLFTAKKDENGNVVVGNQATDQSQMLVNGSNAIYRPSENSTSLQDGVNDSLWVYTYIPKSWLYELFFGKQYTYVELALADVPKAVSNKDISVTFSGYDKAQINIASNSNIRINENISAITGDINIKGNNIYVDTLNSNSSITGKNITLSADGNIGAENGLTVDNSIKVNLTGGKLTAGGKTRNNAVNVYVSLLAGDANNFSVKADNTAYMNVVNGDFYSTSANQVFEANDVQIQARKGSIIADDNLKSGASLSLWANNNIIVDSGEDINAYYIRSDEGDVSLSTDKSINAVVDNDVYYANIIAKNISLEAGKSIGESVDGKELRIEGSQSVSAKADENINLRSLNNMYVNAIEAENNVRLISDMGIINANGEDGINVKAKDLLAVAIMGNIENLDVDLDGTLEAYAGYTDNNGTWSLVNAGSSIDITQVSQKYTEQEAAGLSEADVAGLKDLNIAHAQSANVFLNSEKNILNANSSSDAIIKGTNAVLTATNGSVGEDTNFVTVDLDGTLSVYAKDSVYVESPTNDLYVFEIMGIEDKKANGAPVGADALEMVHIRSAGSILDGNDEYYLDNDGNETSNEKYNVIAKNAVIEAIGTIGTSYDDFNVYTTDANEIGLAASASDIYLSSLDNLIIDSIDVSGDAFIEARHLDADLNDIWKDISINDLNVGNNVTIIADNASINNSVISGIIDAYIDDTFSISSTENINLGTIEGRDSGFTNQVNIDTAKALLNANTDGSDNIKAKDTNIAANSVAEEDNALVLRVPTDGGKLNMIAQNGAYFDVVGDGPLTIENLIANKVVGSIAQDAIIDNSETNSLQLNIGGDVEVNKLTSNTAEINVVGNAEINELTSGATSINIGGEADINKLTSNTAEINIAGNAEINELTGGATSINIGGEADVNKLTSNTADINVGGNTTIDSLTVSDTVNLYAGGNVDINNQRGGTSNITSEENITIKDAILDNIFNAYSDNKVIVGSTGDLNLGTIRGNDNKFAKLVELDVVGNIINAAGGNTDNLRSESTNLYANNIGAEGNDITLRVPATGGYLNMIAKNDAYLKIVGDGPVDIGQLGGNKVSLSMPGDMNIDYVNVNHLVLNAGGDMNINRLITDEAYITNGTPFSSIEKGTIRDYAEIKTKDKLVIVDNKNLSPRHNANAQIYAPGKDIYLKLDSTQRILTDYVNVTRHDSHNTIHDTHERRSMNSNIFQDGHSTIMHDRHISISESGSDHMSSKLRWSDHHMDGSAYKNIWQKYITDWYNVSETDELELSEDDSSSDAPAIVLGSNDIFHNLKLQNEYKSFKNYVNVRY